MQSKIKTLFNELNTHVFSLALSSISARNLLRDRFVLFINLLRKGLTPRACVGDGGSN